MVSIYLTPSKVDGSSLVCLQVSIGVRMLFLFNGSLRASRILYERMIRRLLAAPIRFFDSTPAGRITNRLSKDMGAIDTELAPIGMYLVTSTLASFAVLLVITVSTPLFIFAAVVISLLFWVIGSLYLVISRQLKRIESVSRSPICELSPHILMTRIVSLTEHRIRSKTCASPRSCACQPFRPSQV